MKILLVEDSPTLRHAMNDFIRKAGHECIIAESGEQAVQLVEKNPVEMIIMDVEMPGLDGFETTTLIREMLGDHWIPIIFVTGKADDQSVEQGIEAGGDDYLVKPVSQIILNAKIRAMERITTMRNQLATLNEELRLLSQRDPLTQLLNRRSFSDKAEEQWQISTRAKEPFCILLLDIDHFKQFNDYYGHPEGDTCIKTVAATLKRCMNRPGDIVARYGGEEFIALLPNTPEPGAKHVCELIRSEIEALQIPHIKSMVSNVVTVSIGATVVNYTTSTDLPKQIELADKALYHSKNMGRNQATISEYTPEGKVLLVDDCKITLEVIEDNLMGHCKVITTTSGEEALDIARVEQPDLILLDVLLPGVNGFEICKHLKESSQTSSIPVILISSCDIDELNKQGEFVQANECLQKPVDANRLIAKISQYLG